MKATHCPNCGARLPDVRLGIRLPPLKARIFDVVKLTGDQGACFDFINRMVYGGGGNWHTIKAHIWQINDLIEDTGWRITRTNPRHGYRLKHRTENQNHDQQTADRLHRGR